MQDATAQMALLQFFQAGRKRVAVPTTVHCDHLIQARAGASADLPAALQENREVFEFLRAASAKLDRKSTRLNSSHLVISYAVFCLKKKKNKEEHAHLSDH